MFEEYKRHFFPIKCVTRKFHIHGRAKQLQRNEQKRMLRVQSCCCFLLLLLLIRLLFFFCSSRCRRYLALLDFIFFIWVNHKYTRSNQGQINAFQHWSWEFKLNILSLEDERNKTTEMNYSFLNRSQCGFCFLLYIAQPWLNLYISTV